MSLRQEDLVLEVAKGVFGDDNVAQGVLNRQVPEDGTPICVLTYAGEPEMDRPYRGRIPQILVSCRTYSTDYRRAAEADEEFDVALGANTSILDKRYDVGFEVLDQQDVTLDPAYVRVRVVKV